MNVQSGSDFRRCRWSSRGRRWIGENSNERRRLVSELPLHPAGDLLLNPVPALSALRRGRKVLVAAKRNYLAVGHGVVERELARSPSGPIVEAVVEVRVQYDALILSVDEYFL